MRKFLFSFFALLFLFLTPSLARADSYGYNVVNNFYNTDGSFNDKVFELLAGGTATVRLISGEINAHPGLITDIEAAAREYGVSLIWQPEDWHATTAAEFDAYWVDKLSQISMGTISLFTEYNYFDGSPSEYAAILQSALNAGFQVPVGTTNFNITNPTDSGMTEYVEFLQEVDNNCHCLDQIPVWSVSIYGRYDGTNVDQAVDDFMNQLQGFKDVLTNLGVDLTGKTIIIPEAGLDPSKPIGERLNLAVQFAQELENRGVPGVEGITFLLMDDKTGKQYLVVKVCDGAGNCQWVVMDYDDFGIIGLSGPTSVDPRRIGSAYGQSFTWRKIVCWGNYNEAISAIIRGIETKVSDTQELATSLEFSNENLLLPAEENESEGLESTGEIEFEVCSLGTQDYFDVKDSIKIQIPRSYELSSTNATQLGGYLSLPESSLNRLTRLHDSDNPSSRYLAQKLSDPQIINQPAVLAESTSCPNIGFSTWGEGGRLCWAIEGVTGAGYDACDWGYEILVGGTPVAGIPMVGGGGNCLIKPPESGSTRITCHDGGTNPVSFSGSQVVSLNITQVSGAQDCRSELARSTTCVTQDDGQIVCTDASGNPIAAPEPPVCEPRFNDGQPLDFDVNVANSGEASTPIRHGASEESFFNELGVLIGFCKDVNFVFTPISNVPFTFPDEGIQRGLYKLMSLPGDEDPFNFLDSETRENTFEVEQSKSSNEETFDTDLDIFGQKGVDNSYKYTQELLTPPNY